MPPEPEASPSTPPDRRASLERIRAVGQTFAEGIAAIRERVTKPSPERDHDQIASPVSDDREHRQAALEAAETRADTAEAEAIRLRAENDALRAASDKSTRLLDDLRRELARLRKEVAPAADAVRLRIQLAEREKQLKEVSERTRVVEREAAEEGRRRSALERVCIGLRSKAALAEERVKEVGRLQDAELAREEAETRLAELRAEVERLRVKVGAVDVLKERAEASEKSERALRDKINAMDRELEQREALVQQGLVERRRLTEFVTRYERELGEKDRKIMKLRRALRRREQVRDESDGETDATLSVEKNIAAEEELGDWDHELTVQSLESQGPLPPPPTERRVAPVTTEGLNFPESSPLMKEVEEQHAILEAAWDEDRKDKPNEGSDLEQRVRRLEARLNAFRQGGINISE